MKSGHPIIDEIILSGTTNQTLSVEFDDRNLKSSFMYAGGASAYAYDGDALLIGVTDGSRTWAIDRNDPATPGVSNSTGRVETIRDGDLTITPTYTSFGEIDTYTYDIDSSEYIWDLNVDIGGRIDGKAETFAAASTDFGYDYDSIGQLAEVIDHEDSNAIVESYDYDANGNRTSSTVDYGTAVTRTYAYSADDQLTAINGDEVEYDYDLDGFLTERRRDTGSTIEVTGYNYNTRGDLLSVNLPAGGAVERVEYVYDALGRRVARRSYDDEDTLLSTEKYLWNGLRQLLAVYDGSNQLKMRFDYLGGGSPIGVDVWDGSEFDYYYLAYDQLGSLRVVFDETGTVAKEIAYDAFGNILSDSNPSLNLQIGFAGGHTDQDTDLVRFVARDYDPEVGRWISADPIGIQGGLNLYLYVGNDPVNATDPYGLASRWGQRIEDTALKYEESTAWNVDVWKRWYPPASYKCNVFVADAARKAGAIVPINRLVGPSILNILPGEILAGEWADPSYPIEGWEVVDEAQPGDIIATKEEGGAAGGASGHVGIVVCRGGKLQTISASSEKNMVVVNDYGFRQGQKPVFRRYNHDAATERYNNLRYR